MKRNPNLVFFLVVLVAMAAVAWASASSYISEGKVVTLSWSVASPKGGEFCLKCTSKATGGLVGVALDGTETASENIRVLTEGIFDLSVTASSTVGNIAIGDYIFASVDGINTHSSTLSNINSGIICGQALEAVTASSTAGVYSTINVKLLQPSHL